MNKGLNRGLWFYKGLIRFQKELIRFRRVATQGLPGFTEFLLSGVTRVGTGPQRSQCRPMINTPSPLIRMLSWDLDIGSCSRRRFVHELPRINPETYTVKTKRSPYRWKIEKGGFGVFGVGSREP